MIYDSRNGCDAMDRIFLYREFVFDEWRMDWFHFSFLFWGSWSCPRRLCTLMINNNDFLCISCEIQLMALCQSKRRTMRPCCGDAVAVDFGRWVDYIIIHRVCLCKIFRLMCRIWNYFLLDLSLHFHFYSCSLYAMFFAPSSAILIGLWIASVETRPFVYHFTHATFIDIDTIEALKKVCTIANAKHLFALNNLKHHHQHERLGVRIFDIRVFTKTNRALCGVCVFRGCAVCTSSSLHAIN